MLTKTRDTPGNSPAPGVIPDTIAAPVRNGASVAGDVGVTPGQPTAEPASRGETRSGRFRREARLTRLHAYAIAVVALAAFLIALAASNTAQVKVNWVFGTSRVSLVWLVLFAAILGWLLGLATSARLQWRSRAPR